MKVFVTGATGVLGSAAVPKVLAAGHEVTGLARSAAKAALLRSLGASPASVGRGADGAVAFGRDAKQMAAIVDGHDVVVNLATHIPTGFRAARRGAWRENDRIRDEGSRTLVEAARMAEIPRFVQEAIGYVYADGGDAWLSEDSPVEPTDVAKSSLKATSQAMAFADGLHFAVVLRFGQFYGDDVLSRWQLAMARRDKPCVLGTPDGYVSPVHIGDAADAVVASLGAPSGIYNVAAKPVRRSEYAEVLGHASGQDAAARFVSSSRQRLLGWRASTTGRSLRMSSDAYARATGWQARTPLTDGWPRTA